MSTSSNALTKRDGKRKLLWIQIGGHRRPIGQGAQPPLAHGCLRVLRVHQAFPVQQQGLPGAIGILGLHEGPQPSLHYSDPVFGCGMGWHTACEHFACRGGDTEDLGLKHPLVLLALEDMPPWFLELFVSEAVVSAPAMRGKEGADPVPRPRGRCQ